MAAPGEPVEIVAPGVRRLLAANPSPMTGRGTNTYLLGTPAIAIDPGPDLAGHVEAILALGPVALSLVTHAHRDHLPAALRLRERTGAPIAGHPDLPGVDRPLADGAALEVAGVRLVAIATPGHAPEHLCFWEESRRLLFAGDLIAGVGTIVLADAPNALGQYMSSLERLRALGRSTLLPGHGPVVPDGLARVEQYVAHRLGRERQILAALAEGPSTVEALVARLYADTAPSLRAAASRNVCAHLERLAQLGRASPAGDAWRLVD